MNTNAMGNIQDEIKSLLCRYTKEDVAFMIGVSSRSVSNYEEGKQPSKEVARKIQETYTRYVTNEERFARFVTAEPSPPSSDKDELISLLRKEILRLEGDLHSTQHRYHTVEASLKRMEVNLERANLQAEANREYLRVMFQHIAIHREATEKLPPGSVARDMGISLSSGFQGAGKKDI